MSFTDPSAEPVQPEEGQGDAEATGGSPWESHLTRFPEEYRDTAAEVFREMEGHATKRFQEHADYRKQWEPYEQSGVSQYSPQDIQAVFQLLSDPESARAWLDQNYGPVQAAEPEAPETFPGFEDQSQQQLEQLLESKLSPLQQQVEQWQERWTQFEQQAHEAQIGEQVEQAIAELEAKEAENLPEELRGQFGKLIERFGMQYAEEGADPKQVVQRAFADLQSVLNAAQKSAFQSAADGPQPPVQGGVPDVSPPQYKRIQDARGPAEELLRSMNRQ